MKSMFNLAALAALLSLTPAAPALAADSGPSTPAVAAADPLAKARDRIAQKNWASAIDELKRVNATGSADWNNLMGYSLRKGKAPDLAGAGRYYDAALRIDPKHHGALEYSGELALMQGDLPKAEQRLTALEQVCGMKCEEYGDLKEAVARFKAAGNHYVAER
jgi:tetratricopeptide (TPR) repeat protein